MTFKSSSLETLDKDVNVLNPQTIARRAQIAEMVQETWEDVVLQALVGFVGWRAE